MQQQGHKKTNGNDVPELAVGVHFHPRRHYSSMVSATSGTHGNPANILLSAPASTTSVNSFAQQLAASLEQYLNQSRNGSQLEVDIQSALGTSTEQGSSTGQFLITVRTPQSIDPNSSATGPAPPPSSQADSTQANEYVQVAFGNSMITVPTLAAELARQHAAMAVRTPAAILQQDKVS